MPSAAFYTSRLKSIFLVITAKCNLFCKFCAVQKDATFDIELNTAEVINVLSQAKELGTDYMFITGGEPFIRPDLGDIVRFAINNGIRVGIATNGTLLNRDTLEWARNIPYRSMFFGISIDGASSETHDRLRGRKGCLEATIKGLEFAREMKIPVIVQTILQKDNLSELYDISRIAASFQAEHRVIPEIMPKGRGVDCRQNNISIQEILAVSNELYKLRKSGIADTFINLPPALLPPRAIAKMYLPCHWAVHFCGILPNGDVMMCHGCDTCNMRASSVFAAGNVQHSGLRRIWTNSDTFNALRAFDPNSLKGICGRCVLRTYCRGFCRVRSYLEYGCLDGPEILCQHAYEAGLFPEYLLSGE